MRLEASGWSLSPLRAAVSKVRAWRRTLLERRTFSMMIVQQPREARTRRIMTPLTIGSACRNRPRNDRSCGVVEAMSFMMQISFHEGDGVDLGGCLDSGQAFLA